MANPNQSEKSVALDREENITKGNLSAKKVALYSYDSALDTLAPFTRGGLLPGEYDEINITSYNANNDPLIVIYKLATVTKATLTITYDGSNRITSVVRT